MFSLPLFSACVTIMENGKLVWSFLHPCACLITFKEHKHLAVIVWPSREGSESERRCAWYTHIPNNGLSNCCTYAENRVPKSYAYPSIYRQAAMWGIVVPNECNKTIKKCKPIILDLNSGYSLYIPIPFWSYFRRSDLYIWFSSMPPSLRQVQLLKYRCSVYSLIRQEGNRE